MSKISYYEDEAILFQYEIWDLTLVLHCEISIWKPSVLKTSYKVFGQFLDEMSNKGFTRAVSVTPNPRFLSLFGGDSIGTTIAHDKEMEVFVWDLKQ